MKPALLIIMLVCTTTAACTARAVDIGLGDPTPSATAIPLDQGSSNQPISSNDAAPSNNNADTSSSDQHTADLQIQLSPSSTTNTVASPRPTAARTVAPIPAVTGDDAGHSHTPSWQSLLPGSIQ